jgi:hypothetical protein
MFDVIFYKNFDKKNDEIQIISIKSNKIKKIEVKSDNKMNKVVVKHPFL